MALSRKAEVQEAMDFSVESLETPALTKAPRPGRNPRTGESIPIEARRVVTFHASHKLKEQIQGEGAEPV